MRKGKKYSSAEEKLPKRIVRTHQKKRSQRKINSHYVRKIQIFQRSLN